MVIQKSSEQINYLLKSYRETSSHVIELRQQCETQKERLSRLQQRFTNMVRGHIQSVDNPEDQAIMLEEMLANMKSEMDALQKENEKLKLQLETVKKEADEALNKAQKLSVEVKPSDREHEDTLMQLKNACSEITALINQHESLKKELEDTKARNNTNMSYMNKLNSDFKAYREQTTKKFERIKTSRSRTY